MKKPYYPRKLQPEQIKEAVELKNKSWSFQQIANRYAVNYSTIIHHFRRLGITDYPRCHRGPKKQSGRELYRKLKPVKQYRDYLNEQEKRENPDPIERAKKDIHKTLLTNDKKS